MRPLIKTIILTLTPYGGLVYSKRPLLLNLYFPTTHRRLVTWACQKPGSSLAAEILARRIQFRRRQKHFLNWTGLRQARNVMRHGVSKSDIQFNVCQASLNSSSGNKHLKGSQMQKHFSFLIYLLILISLFSIIQFEVYKRSSILEGVHPFWIFFRIFFSGPLLLLCALTLIFFYRDRIHKIFGGLSLIAGCYWTYLVFKDI